MNSQNFSGADLDQLRALSARLKSQSGKMREVANSSTFALMAAEWTGGEIDAIRDQWRRNSLPTITRLADSLEQLGSDLDQHVAEQERVSAGDSGGPLGNLIDWIRRSIDKFIVGIIGASPVESPRAPTPGAPEGGGGGDGSQGGAPGEQVAPDAPSNNSSRNASVLNNWRNGVPDGTKIDWDGAHGVQCVDVVRHYLNSYFPGRGVGGGFDYAYQMYDHADPALMERIPPGGTPQVGDIIVIGPNDYSPTAGHVAIVDRVDADGTVHVIQQSGGTLQDQARGVFTGKPSRIEMDALVGYLRPKS